MCLLIWVCSKDLHNREIIGYCAGKNKNASLVEQALLNCRYSLKEIQIFHSDRWKEFDNSKLDKIFRIFGLKRSLSRKGNPYDNAVIESTNHILKTEFIKRNKFKNLDELKATNRVQGT